MKNNVRKKYIILVAVTILVSVIALIGASYAILTMTIEGDKKITITAGILKVDFTDGNYINLDNAAPVTDRQGLKGTPYTFTITNTGNLDAYYHLSLEEDSANTLSNSYLKMRLIGDNGYDSGVVKVNNYGTGTFEIKGEEILNPSNKVTYQLWMWLSDDADNNAMGKEYKSKIVVTSYDRKQDNANAPELDDNMIAVYYNGSSWVKADASKNYWYNYNTREWANAVTVSSAARDKYLSAEVGTEISMNDIETMWVWIPRYSYTIGSEDGVNYYGKQGEYLDTTPTLSLPGEIDIKFIDKGTKDRGSAQYIVNEGIQSDDWYTPDAFTFGDTELSGIWVGKFETSSSNPSASSGGDNTTDLDPMIKPNVTSWRNINVSNAFNVSLKMNDEGNRYGFSSKVDTHMMKNDEWAVVAYLSQSKYGKLGNINFSGKNKEIYQNKSDQFITGCSWGAPGGETSENYGCQYTYDVEINGTGASTTGNIYGIYDMSGGAWEYVMGNYNGIVGNSGFASMPEEKYYNKYMSSDILTACNGSVCKSHSLSETAEWFFDVKNMINESRLWVVRSGFYSDGRNAGLFYFSDTNIRGGADSFGSFRLALIKPSL